MDDYQTYEELVDEMSSTIVAFRSLAEDSEYGGQITLDAFMDQLLIDMVSDQSKNAEVVNSILPTYEMKFKFKEEVKRLVEVGLVMER